MGTTISSPEESGVAAADISSPEEAGEVPVRKKDSLPVDESLLPEELTSKYEAVEKIGTGSFGAVYKVRDRTTGTVYAAKYVECKENTASEVR